jgi:hypothetical protein
LSGGEFAVAREIATRLEVAVAETAAEAREAKR